MAESKVTLAQTAYKRLLYKEKLMNLHDERRGGKLPPFSIEPVPRERTRLAKPMSDETRALRKQWVLDQQLAPNEPVHVPELEPKNPIKRIYRAPMDFLFMKVLKPVLGEQAAFARYIVPKALIGMFAIYATYYHLKYNSSDWEREKGWHVYTSRRPLYPGDDTFPNAIHKQPQEFNDRGFSKRTANL